MVADLIGDCAGLRAVVEGRGQNFPLSQSPRCPYWRFLTQCRDLHIPGQLDYTVIMRDSGGHLFPTTTEVWSEHGAASIKALLHAEDNGRIRTYSVLGLTHVPGCRGRTAQVSGHPAEVAGLSTQTKKNAAVNHSKTGTKTISRGATSAVTPQSWAAKAAEAPSNPVSHAMDKWPESWGAWASSSEYTAASYELRVSIRDFVDLVNARDPVAHTGLSQLAHEVFESSRPFLAVIAPADWAAWLTWVSCGEVTAVDP